MRPVTALVICIASLCCAQVPSFQAKSVVAGDRVVPLRPGLVMSIYGEHLGPAIGCEGRWVSTGYPLSLCDTRVAVGGVPAELLYVAEKQINFMVPQRVGYEGTTKLEVVYRDKASAVVAVPLGLESATVALESPAKVGGPVWLKVSGAGWVNHVRYPFEVRPDDFGCNQIEVRRNGTLVAPIEHWRTLAVVSFERPGPCGGIGLPGESHHIGRIPIHLRYRFDSPGFYEVRLTVNGLGRPSARSPWTAIRILPGTAAARARWLAELSRHAPTDAVGLLTDYLPSILGVPDAQSHALMSGYLNHQDPLVREFAKNGLNYWQSDAAGPAKFGFDRNLYPGDAALASLRRTFAFTGYWLNSPPGAGASSWLGKRSLLRKNGFGFLVLFNGRLFKDLRGVGVAERLGAADGALAAEIARKEGFPGESVLFLDQEEGGRLVPEQLAYVMAWMKAVAARNYGVGIYCSGIDVHEGDGTVINTAKQIRQVAGTRRVHFFVYNDSCPPSAGCAYPREAPDPKRSGIQFAEVWQIAQSPRRPALTGRCASTYSAQNLCLAPGSTIDIDLSTASSADPSHGR